jgi:threonine/homoserine/homoserine lactone efflux protein
MIAYLLQGIALGFVAAVQPGPLQTYVIIQALRNGWRRTIIYSLVPLLSDLPIIALVLVVLARIPSAFILGIRFVGGFFLLYLAFITFRTMQKMQADPVVQPDGDRAGLLKAVMVNFLNPNPYLYWGLFAGPILLVGWRETPVNGIALVAGFYLTMIIVMSALIIVFSTTRRLPLIVRKILMAVSTIGLVFFGLYQIWLGVSQIHG